MILTTVQHARGFISAAQIPIILQEFPALLRGATYPDQPPTNRSRNKVFLNICEFSQNTVCSRPMLIKVQIVGNLTNNHPLFSEDGCHALKVLLFKKIPVLPSNTIGIDDFDLLVQFVSGVVA